MTYYLRPMVGRRLRCLGARSCSSLSQMMQAMILTLIDPAAASVSFDGVSVHSRTRVPCCSRFVIFQNSISSGGFLLWLDGRSSKLICRLTLGTQYTKERKFSCGITYSMIMNFSGTVQLNRLTLSLPLCFATSK